MRNKHHYLFSHTYIPASVINAALSSEIHIVTKILL